MTTSGNLPGIIQLKSLLGDSLCTQVGFTRLHPGTRVRVVVPASGPYAYLRALWEMSSLAAEVIPLEDADVESPETERKTRLRAIDALRARGCSHLYLLPSEDFGLGDPTAFYGPVFNTVERCDDAFFESFAFPHGLDIRPSDQAQAWADAFLQERGIEAFLAAHIRDAVWNTQRRAVGCHHSGDVWNSMRNHSARPLVQAALDALDPSVHVIRIGSAGAPLAVAPRVHDTVPMGLDLHRQVALLKRARYFMGGLSGPVTFPWLFGTPMLIVNNPLIGCTWSRPDTPMISLEKTILKDGRELGFTEVPLLVGGGAPGRLSESLGYQVVENTPEVMSEALRRLVAMTQAGTREHWVVSRGRYLSEPELIEAYTGQRLPPGCCCPQVFMAFEQAIHAASTPTIELIFRTFPPTQMFQAGLYGAGQNGRSLLTRLRALTRWDLRVFDSAAALHGTSVAGIKVEAPDAIRNAPPDLLILSTSTDVEALLDRFESDGWARGRKLFHFQDDSRSGYRTFWLNPVVCEDFAPAALGRLGLPGGGGPAMSLTGTALVLGGASTLGQALLPLAHTRFQAVRATHAHRPIPGGIPFVLGRDRLAALAAEPGDTLFLLAGATNPNWIREYPERSEAESFRPLLALIDEASARDLRLVFYSTELVFDGITGGYLETDPPAPTTRYGQQKAALEKRLAEYPRCLVIRTGAQVTAAEADNCVVRKTYETLLQPGARFPEDATLSITPVESLLDATFQLLSREAWGLWHVAGTPMTRATLARTIQAASRYRDAMHFTVTPFSEIPYPEPRPRHAWLRTDRLQAFLERRLPDPGPAIQAKVALLDRTAHP